MAYRNYWNREQWLAFSTGECVNAGHEDPPCEQHRREAEEGFQHHVRLVNRDEVTESTQRWMDRNLRPGAERQIARPFVPDPPDERTLPPSPRGVAPDGRRQRRDLPDCR